MNGTLSVRDPRHSPAPEERCVIGMRRAPKKASLSLQAFLDLQVYERERVCVCVCVKSLKAALAAADLL